MAGTFPTISRGDVCLYPVGRTLASATTVITFADDSELRFKSAAPMNAWVLTYPALIWADVDTLRTFFATQKGAFDSTWNFPFLGATYAACVFDQDEFSYERDQRGRYSVSLRFRQTKKGETPAALGAFPSVRQTPLVAFECFETVRNDMPSGLRYSYANRGTALRKYTLNFPWIDETELGTVMTHFVNAGGRWKSFSFTDPNDLSSVTVRYASDTLEARYIDRRHCSMTVQLEQVAA